MEDLIYKTLKQIEAHERMNRKHLATIKYILLLPFILTGLWIILVMIFGIGALALL